MKKITSKYWFLTSLILLALIFLSACGGGSDNKNVEKSRMISGSINAESLSVSDLKISLDENNDGSIDSIVTSDNSGNWNAEVNSDLVRVIIDSDEFYPKEYIYNLDEHDYKIKFNDRDSLNISSLRVEADYKIDLTDTLNISNVNNINWVPSVLLGVPNLNREELIDLNRRPELAKEEIDVVFEALAYMALNFTTESGNVKLKEEGIDWEFSKPAELAIRDGKVNCAAAANVIKYLLEDDYQEIGYYWTYTDGRGGHVINYVIQDDSYYFFDPVSISAEKSKFPIENGDTKQNADWADGVTKAGKEDYVKFWLNASEEMDIAAIYSNTANALGAGITEENSLNMYFPKFQNAEEITIWSTDNDSVRVLESKFNPVPPEIYSNYYPYNKYSQDEGVLEKYDHLKLN